MWPSYRSTFLSVTTLLLTASALGIVYLPGNNLTIIYKTEKCYDYLEPTDTFPWEAWMLRSWKDEIRFTDGSAFAIEVDSGNTHRAFLRAAVNIVTCKSATVWNVTTPHGHLSATGSGIYEVHGREYLVSTVSHMVTSGGSFIHSMPTTWAKDYSLDLDCYKHCTHCANCHYYEGGNLKSIPIGSFTGSTYGEMWNADSFMTDQDCNQQDAGSCQSGEDFVGIFSGRSFNAISNSDPYSLLCAMRGNASNPEMFAVSVSPYPRECISGTFGWNVDYINQAVAESVVASEVIAHLPLCVHIECACDGDKCLYLGTILCLSPHGSIGHGQLVSRNTCTRTVEAHIGEVVQQDIQYSTVRPTVHHCAMGLCAGFGFIDDIVHGIADVAHDVIKGTEEGAHEAEHVGETVASAPEHALHTEEGVITKPLDMLESVGGHLEVILIVIGGVCGLCALAYFMNSVKR